MAVCIAVSSLSQDQIHAIEQHLKIDAQKYNSRFNSSNSNSIFFYKIDDRVRIHLPLFYAQRLFQRIHFNQHRSIPPFAGQPYQICFEWFYWQPPIIAKAQQALQQYGTCTIASPPGSGKTIMGTFLALCPYSDRQVLPQLILIICPRRPLIKQWANTITKITPYGFTVDTDARRQYLNLQTRAASERLPIGFIISTPGLINTIPDDVLRMVGTLIVDEAHMCCSPGAVHALLSVQPERVILCSATPCRQDEYIKMLYCLAGQHQITSCRLKSYKVFSIRTGWLYPEKHQVNNIFGKRQVVVNATDLEKRYSTSPRYCQLLVYLLRYLVHQNRKIMVISRFKFMFEQLEPLLVQAQLPFGRFYGNVQKFDESPILLSTVQKGGTGFDEENFCDQFSGIAINTVILASSIAFKGLLFQVIGRGLRGNDPWVFDIAHENNSLENRRKDRVALYNKTNGTIFKWDMDDALLRYLEQFPI